MVKIIYMLLCVKYLPFIIAYIVMQSNTLKDDIEHYIKFFHYRYNYYFTLAYLLEKVPEFRNIFYFRYPQLAILKFFYPGVRNCYFFMSKDKIGGGLILWHGFSTVINAISIGKNCEIWHNVTIGKKSTLPISDKPIIGNNVKICANAVLIGAITIGDNVTIGAGSVVTKNIPPNSIVVGNPARIL